MKKEIAQKILNETEAGYDLIAKKFSQTRKHFWRGLEFIADYAKPGDKVLDYGCGNGRLLELIGEKDIEYFGVDVSEKLIEFAKRKYLATELNSESELSSVKVHFAKISPSQTTLPFEDGFFNSIYSIAVFHHFPSRKYREDMARELYRVTKNEGVIVVTVWYLWQKKYVGNVLKNWLRKLAGKSDLDWNDCQISFTDNQGRVFQRFHHAFTKKELRKLFSAAGFEIERCEIISGRNILLVAKK